MKRVIFAVVVLAALLGQAHAARSLKAPGQSWAARTLKQVGAYANYNRQGYIDDGARSAYTMYAAVVSTRRRHQGAGGAVAEAGAAGDDPGGAAARAAPEAASDLARELRRLPACGLPSALQPAAAEDLEPRGRHAGSWAGIVLRMPWWRGAGAAHPVHACRRLQPGLPSGAGTPIVKMEASKARACAGTQACAAGRLRRQPMRSRTLNCLRPPLLPLAMPLLLLPSLPTLLHCPHILEPPSLAAAAAPARPLANRAWCPLLPPAPPPPVRQL
jgi:hypothetical protein